MPSSSPQPTANAAQIDYWNAVAGETWARFQEQLDRQIESLGDRALQALDPREGERLLDIGCGCGQTSVALARRVGAGGSVRGVDISKPMLDVAQTRPAPAGAARPVFAQMDAQTGDLGEAMYDAAFSRFGVMFFADPTAAFVNIRRALKPGGRLAFVCWRPFAENAWMRLPMEAAAPFLPPAVPMDPLAPGPFAFADPERVRGILADGGWGSVSLDPFDALIGGGTVDEALALAFRVGPLGAALRDNPGSVEAVSDAVRAVLTAHHTPRGVMMPAAVWIVQARA